MADGEKTFDEMSQELVLQATRVMAERYLR